ncbi:MAG: sigma-54 interaction domain-containing protein [Eubacterium sp.]|jgi:arginine utilization regulatory protein
MNDTDYKVILEELLKILKEGVYIVDDNGVGIFYNDSMSKIEQIEVDDVIGKEYHRAFPGVPVSESTMFKALKKGISISNKQQTYRNLYGREVTTVNTTVPVKHGGRTVAAIEVANDITNIRTMSDTIMDLQGKHIKPGKAAPHIRKYTFDDLVGSSEVFKAVVDRAKRASATDATVFIYGETGTGKELIAQSIHYDSERRKKPFLAQNCAAMPESLLEGILFGTEKGGFTGAVDREGLFEQASGGTLLLDEVSAMPFELQGKLLRTLQEMYIRRVGGTKDIPIDTRIIATVNEDPLELIKQNRLRKDLYYRLNVVNIRIPPLRDRLSDIPELVDAFLTKCNKRFGREVWMVNDEALERLADYNYPGNVRELENIITQAVALARPSNHVLTAHMLQMPMQTGAIGSDISKWDRHGPLPEYLESLESEIIREQLMENGGNVTKTAAALKIKRQTLQHKMNKYGMKGE